jgi:hypothetical protein
MATEQEIGQAAIRRRVLKMADDLALKLSIESGWRMEAYPLRDVLRKIGANYPVIHDAEFAELVAAIDSIIYLLKVR